MADALGVYNPNVAKPIRCPRQKLVKPGELERVVEFAARKVGGAGQIIILVDSESDCPKQLAPQLLNRALSARPNFPIFVVLAKMEFEAWFLGSIESIRPGSVAPFNPEGIQGAKERLQQLIEKPYAETVDQASLSAQFDMGLARQRCPSFDKCWRAMESLLETAADS